MSSHVTNFLLIGGGGACVTVFGVATVAGTGAGELISTAGGGVTARGAEVTGTAAVLPEISGGIGRNTVVSASFRRLSVSALAGVVSGIVSVFFLPEKIHFTTKKTTPINSKSGKSATISGIFRFAFILSRIAEWQLHRLEKLY
jgi:hypothetical protein